MYYIPCWSVVRGDHGYSSSGENMQHTSQIQWPCLHMDHSLAQAAATSATTLWFALYILPDKTTTTCRYFIINQTPGSISKKFQITIKVINDSLKAVIKKIMDWFYSYMYKHHTNNSSDLDYIEFWLQACKIMMTFQKCIPGPWKFNPFTLKI